MFHWICPECGREIPPAVKECPDCDPQAVSATPPALPQLPRLATATAPAPALAPPSAKVSPPEAPSPAFVPPQLRGFSPTRLSNAIQTNSLPPELPMPAEELVPAPPAATALLDLPAELPTPQCPGPDFTKRTHQLLPPPQASVLSRSRLDRLGLAQVLLPPMVPNGLVPAIEPFGPPPLPDVSPAAPSGLPVLPEAPVTSAPAESAPPAPAPAAATPPALAPTTSVPEAPAQLAAPDPQPPELAVLAEAVAPEAVDAIEVREEPRQIDMPLAASVALPAPRISAAVAPLAPSQPSRAFGPEPAATPGRTPSCGDLRAPSPRPAKDQLPIPAVRKSDAAGSRLGTAGDSLMALPAEPGQPIRPGLQPTVAPPIGGLVDYSARAVKAIRPVPPAQAWFVPPAEPRITLPGPMLPRELNSLAEAGLRTVHEAPRAARRRRSGSGRVWLALTAVTVVAAAAVYIVPALLYTGKTTAVQAEDVPNADATPLPPADVRPSGAYVLSKTVEVTGFRFVVDLNSKSEIHYLVVNHSGAQFGGVTVYVTLRESSAKPGQPPLARFSFRAPEMGPYSSREMTSPIERISRQTTLPDWQSLQAEVEIAE